MMDAAKTTFYLSQALRTRLKQAAAARQKTLAELLTEGAELVLARYEGMEDREKLIAAAKKARAQMRRGLYRGTPVTENIDEPVYRVRDSRAKARKKRSRA